MQQLPQNTSLQEEHDEEEDYGVQPMVEDQLVAELDGKPGKDSSFDIARAYNKYRNHFSKSTADDSEIGVRDLECLLQEDHPLRKSGQLGNKAANRVSNNRFSSVVGSI